MTKEKTQESIVSIIVQPVVVGEPRDKSQPVPLVAAKTTAQAVVVVEVVVAPSASPPASKKQKQRRRSQRNTHRLRLPHRATLANRRLDQIFFQNDTDDKDSDASSESSAAASSSSSLARSETKSEQPTRTVVFVVHHLKLQRIHHSPHIYIINNFLTLSELTHFRAHIAKGRFERSYIDKVNGNVMKQRSILATATDNCDDDDEEDTNAGSSGSSSSATTTRTTALDSSSEVVVGYNTALDDAHRTSTFLAFSKQHDSKIAAIEQRAADVLGTTSIHIEALQLVRYLPGQFFGVHHDLGEYDESTGVVGLPPKSYLSKRRLVTLFCYLNDLDPSAGGATCFPQATNTTTTNNSQNEKNDPNPLRITPVAGRAVLFSNVNRHGLPDPRTVHAGEPVLQPGTVKYGVNIWLCEE
jgi:hypothetical protein